jgi:hypothetical protein
VVNIKSPEAGFKSSEHLIKINLITLQHAYIHSMAIINKNTGIDSMQSGCPHRLS